MPRPALSPSDIEEFRQDLCHVAERRFAESGYAGVTLRALAAELGVSAMTPYRYFRDKDEILTAVRAAGFSRFADDQERAAQASADPTDTDRLLCLGRAYADFAVREPHAYRIMFEMNLPGGHHPDLVREAARAWAPLHAAVAAAVESGELHGDVDDVARVFWAGLHGVVSLDLAGTLQHGGGLGDLVEPMLATLFHGARPRAPQPQETKSPEETR